MTPRVTSAGTDDDDDTEGHVRRGADDGDEDDTEGHQRR